MLVELTPVPAVALPIAELSAHLHLGTGFADDGSQNSVLESYLRAAIGAIETRIGKALITREFSWQITNWRDGGSQGLPVAPVAVVNRVRLSDAAGTQTIADAALYRLRKDFQRPVLVATGHFLPAIPSGGFAEIDFDAGFGATWGDVPVDLGQAVLLLAAHYYENRNGGAGQADPMPFGVMALIEAYRVVRVLGGGT